MTSLKYPAFEDKLRAATQMPLPRPEFLTALRARLAEEPPRSISLGERLRRMFRHPAWAVSIIVLLVITGILIAGPQRVFAAVRNLFGYIPGAGIVDNSAPIRVLVEPVSLTRDGITVSVNQAYLSIDQTILDTGISGVPLSAYPKTEAQPGCTEGAYLRFPDGTSQDVSAPIPTHIQEATYVLPCILNTLPGAAPAHWELALRFIPAPPDLPVLPVIEVSPSATAFQAKASPAVIEPQEPTQTPSSATVAVEKVIETEDGYILIGSVKPHIPEGSWLQITGTAVIRDADGRKVSYDYPANRQALTEPSFHQGGDTWALQIKGVGLRFPLTIQYSGVIISQADPHAYAQIAFDAGPTPQPDRVWTLNQEVHLAGFSVRLISVTANQDGYSFQIDPGPGLSSVSVQIDGHKAQGGGGGGTWGGILNTSLAFSELPTGPLTLILSNPLAASPTETWQTAWQPETTRVFAPPPEENASPICLTGETFQAVPPLPAGLDGKMLLTELNPAQQIVLADLDGSQRQVLVSGMGRGALSPDGTRLAYTSEQGMTIIDLLSGEERTLPGATGSGLHWSPDGTKIAYTAAGDTYGVHVIDLVGQAAPRQLSNLGYEAIAGWSPDGQELYFAIPSATNAGFLLRAAHLETGQVTDLFVLTGSSGKAPMPAVSPDAHWVVYRGSDNSSIYQARMDGSERHPVLALPSQEYAITGMAWGPESGLLGVSLITPDTPNGMVFLMQPENCETYRLPLLTGVLDGLFIP